MYLFDTNVLSNLMKRAPSHDLLGRVGSAPVGSQFTSSITLGELIYGARRRGSGYLLDKLDQLAATMLPILLFDAETARRYGEPRADLERQGTPIGDADIRIAAIAHVRKLIVVTGTVRYFQRIPYLTMENWL